LRRIGGDHPHDPPHSPKRSRRWWRNPARRVTPPACFPHWRSGSDPFSCGPVLRCRLFWSLRKPSHPLEWGVSYAVSFSAHTQRRLSLCIRTTRPLRTPCC
jgi:hypothetical protein